MLQKLIMPAKFNNRQTFINSLTCVIMILFLYTFKYLHWNNIEMYDPNHEFNISDTDTDTYYKWSCENTNILTSFLFATYYK